MRVNLEIKRMDSLSIKHEIANVRKWEKQKKKGISKQRVSPGFKWVGFSRKLELWYYV